jgi:hypothetical protein
MTTTRAHDAVVYVEGDIPPEMTIREWRRQRTAARVRSPRRLASAVRGVMAGVGRAVAQPRVARIRARGSRYAAARSAAPSTLKAAP